MLSNLYVLYFLAGRLELKNCIRPTGDRADLKNSSKRGH